MATLLQLQDGTTAHTIDLNSMLSSGFTTESFTLPRVDQDANGVLSDSKAEWIGHIRWTSVSGMEAQLQALVVMLQAAQRWAQDRIGHPIRLAYKRDGITNTAYRVITGVSFPEPASDPRQMTAEAAQMLRIRFTLTLEPIAHAGDVTQIISTTLTVQPGSDRIASAIAPVGDMPGPIMVSLENLNSGTTWASVWLALLEGNPVNQIWNNIADATAYQGRQDFTITTSTTTLYSVSYVPTSELPFRSLLRCKVSAGVETDLELRAVLTIGARDYAGEWYTFTNTIGNWTLMDLGSLRLPRDFFKRASQSDTSPATIAVQARSKNGTITLGADYAQLLTYRSFVRLDALVPYQSMLRYDAVLRDTADSGDFYWPARLPQTFVIDGSANLAQEARRAGVLGQVTPGITTRIWWSASSATAHLWGAGASVIVRYLPSFALGLRGGV